LELFSIRKQYGLKTRILGHPDTFIEHGPQNTLWKNSGIDPSSIVRAAVELLENVAISQTL
ncbi:MAG: hypothetical protein JRJ68_11590, partial [Deltaproteobacteria bacterium]|nr:hypothetical protein [Deltaproteobacteria bacterium]